MDLFSEPGVLINQPTTHNIDSCMWQKPAYLPYFPIGWHSRTCIPDCQTARLSLLASLKAPLCPFPTNHMEFIKKKNASPRRMDAQLHVDMQLTAVTQLNAVARNQSREAWGGCRRTDKAEGGPNRRRSIRASFLYSFNQLVCCEVEVLDQATQFRYIISQKCRAAKTELRSISPLPRRKATNDTGTGPSQEKTPTSSASG